MAPHRLGSASVVKYSRMVDEGVVRGVQIRLLAVGATGLHMWLPWAGLSLVGSLCLSLQTLEHLKLDSYGTPPPLLAALPPSVAFSRTSHFKKLKNPRHILFSHLHPAIRPAGPSLHDSRTTSCRILHSSSYLNAPFASIRRRLLSS